MNTNGHREKNTSGGRRSFGRVDLNYVLCRRLRDRAENPTVGVDVVHQALAAPHTTRGFLLFNVCLTGGCEVADERSPLKQ